MVTAVVCRWTFPWPVAPPRNPLDARRRRNSIGINGMYVATGRGGQRRLSTFAEGAKNGWIKIVVDAGQRLPAGWLALTIDLYPPDGARRDTDGPIKLAQDALFEGQLILYAANRYPPTTAKQLADDYRVKRVTAERHDPDRARPRIEVELAAHGGSA